MSRLDQLLSRALLLKTAPEDVVPYAENIVSHDVAGAEFEASLWPPEDCDPVDVRSGIDDADDEDDDPDPTRQPSDSHDAGADTAAVDLHVLCQAVVTHTATSLNEFITETLPAPTGARAVGCILLLADNEDSARFWWQYAAGAGDNTAGYCLYLHHLARGDALIADWWRSQTRICTEPATYTTTIPSGRSLVDAVTMDAKISTILRILHALTDTPRRSSTMISDVSAYVLSAVTAANRKQADLPVPEGFAKDLRAVMADTARHADATLTPDLGRIQPPRVLVGEWLNS